MKYSVVINQYKRTNFVDRAIQSCQVLIKEPEDTIEIIVVSDFPIKNVDKNILCNVSSVGYRYTLGLKEATGDWIFLLDDDDYMLKDRLKFYNKKALFYEAHGDYFKRFDVIKEHKSKLGTRSYMTRFLSLKYIIRKHVDWHISEYSFSKSFRDELLEKGIDKVDASLDKFLFSLALDNLSKFTLYNDSKVHIEKHRDSKMHSMNNKEKKEFYLKTADVFLKAFSEHRLQTSDYALYCEAMNTFLGMDKETYFKKHSGAYFHLKRKLPLIHRLYYSIIYRHVMR